MRQYDPAVCYNSRIMPVKLIVMEKDNVTRGRRKCSLLSLLFSLSLIQTGTMRHQQVLPNRSLVRAIEKLLGTITHSPAPFCSEARADKTYDYSEARLGRRS